jgi:hypothetical protein
MPPFAPSGGRRNDRSPARRPAAGKSSPDPLDADRRRIERDLEEIRRKEAELKAMEEQKRREMEELPRKIEARRRKEQEMMTLRAAMTATDDVFGRPRPHRSASSSRSGKKRRMTRPEERSARTQFLLLCAVLAVLLILLWKSLP